MQAKTAKIGNTDSTADIGNVGDIARFDSVRYAQCWEDADVLLEGLATGPGDTVLTIAAAGDNALALVGTGAKRVIAIDLNPAQIACLELRAAACRQFDYPEFMEILGHAPSARRAALYAALRTSLSAATRAFWDDHPELVRRGIAVEGKFERYLSAFRRFVLPLIHDRETIRQLFTLTTEEQRQTFYETRWNTRRWRLLCRLFFSRAALGRFGRDPQFMRFADAPVWEHLQRRIPHAMIVQGATANPYLQWILQGKFSTALPYALRPENYERIRNNIDALEWRCCAIEDELRRIPTGTVDGFNLSDIFEYVSEDAYRALIEELIRTGNRGSRLVYWNVAVNRQCPDSLTYALKRRRKLAARLFAKDKAFFYRRLVVEEVAV